MVYQSCYSEGVHVVGKKVFMNGKLLPPVPYKGKNHSVTTIDNNVYIDGYEWTGTKWKRTLKALWYKYF